MNMKKFAVFVAAMAMLATAAFAAKPLEGKKLKMAISPTFPPFALEQLDDKGNANIVGYDNDMVNEIASRLGFTY
ncbi:MAG: hypothetical protein IJ233_01405, partial [Pyramidobacter sp.]|nr:hypothetical protein [Pyramidobacter sp.]